MIFVHNKYIRIAVNQLKINPFILDHFIRQCIINISVQQVLNQLKCCKIQLPYADFRIRPYSVEESLTNVLAPFDYKFVKQKGNMYKLKAYEYPRRTDEDGEKMLAYLNTLYADKQTFGLRTDSLKKEVRQRLGIDAMLAQCVKSEAILSKTRKFDGYTVQNFALETLPGLYV